MLPFVLSEACNSTNFMINRKFLRFSQNFTFNLDDSGSLIASGTVGGQTDVNSVVLGAGIQDAQDVSGLLGVLLENGAIL